jgi:hypothetical protein
MTINVLISHKAWNLTSCLTKNFSRRTLFQGLLRFLCLSLAETCTAYVSDIFLVSGKEYSLKSCHIYLVRNWGNLRHYAVWCVHCWRISQGCRLAMLTVLRRAVCRRRSFWNTTQYCTQVLTTDSTHKHRRLSVWFTFYLGKISLYYYFADFINN